MSGFREQSFNPQSYRGVGRSLRPFSPTQWVGVGTAAAGTGLYLVLVAARSGLMPRALDRIMSGFILTMVGISLINARRQILSDPAPELAAARRRWMIITAVLCSAVLAAAFIIDYAKGA